MSALNLYANNPRTRKVTTTITLEQNTLDWISTNCGNRMRSRFVEDAIKAAIAKFEGEGCSNDK